MKILDFKIVSPLFEMERDGEKPFTIRRIDPKDKRFRALSHWRPEYKWGIRITNPTTSESFIREIKVVSFVLYHQYSDEDWWNIKFLYDWRIIIFGELVNYGE